MDWPHAPIHRFGEGGVYFVTAGTLHKQHFFRTPEALDALRQSLFAQSAAHDCRLQAWALLSNHYHLVIASDDGDKVRRMLRRFHIDTAIESNHRDGTKGRRVWFQCWDTQLTNERSWLARLRYTHENAVHHGVAASAETYPWCSASWFATTARPSLAATVRSFPIDRVKVFDEFDVVST